jgi:hypothetical protein
LLVLPAHLDHGSHRSDENRHHVELEALAGQCGTDYFESVSTRVN